MEPGESVFIDGKDFTYTEFLVIQQAMQGKSYKEIGSALNNAEKTVGTHMQNIYKKLGIHKITDLIAWGYENGFDREGNYVVKTLVIPQPDPSTPLRMTGTSLRMTRRGQIHPPIRVVHKKRKKTKSAGKKLLR